MNFIDKAGGIERIVSQKANYLSNYHDIYIVTTSQKEKQYFYPINTNIKHIDFSEYSEDNLWLQKNVFKKIIKKISPDIVIAVTTKESLLLPLWGGDFITIKEMHFARGYRQRQYENINFLRFIAFYILDFVERYIYKRYDCVVALTNRDAKAWRLKNCEVIENFVPFALKEKSSQTAKRVIAVGRLDYQKGFDRLLRIWKDVALKFPEWILTIAGDGSLKEDLVEQSKKLGIKNQVEFVGNVDQIQKYYLQSSIFVLTSRHEGLPLSLLEAMEAGLCVISFDIFCGPNDIIEQEIDGILVEDGDERDFAMKLSKCIEDTDFRTNLAKNATKKAKKYHIDNVMEKWLLLFKKLKDAK